VAHDDFAFIEEWWRDASPEWDIPGDHLESVKGTFRQPGVVDAALAYYRQTFNPTLQDPNLKELQERVNSSPVPVPTLALHGTRDRPRRLESFQAMDGFYTGGLEKFVVEGTGHFIHMEKPQEVNSRIVRSLAR
jgi:pimeloyl-ACP methyl ester carboxylesterase